MLKSPPLFNERGELIFMSDGDQGFLVFNIDSTPLRKKPGSVHYSFIKVDNKNLSLDSLIKNQGLSLKYGHYNNIQLAFSDYSVFDAEKISYEYALYKKGDTVWNKINGKPELTISDLSPGKYQLFLRASNVFSDYSEEVKAFPVVIIPPWWQTWWSRLLAIMVLCLIAYGIYRYRIIQINHLQMIRNNIASDLHDDIGSTLNSISIYSEVAKQQAGKEIPALDLIGANSRKIVDSMSDIVWTINPDNDSFEKIIQRMRSFAYQLLKAKKVEYTFEVDEKLNSIVLPMQVRKNFYLVFKEAITNVIKYSQASRVSIVLFEKNRAIMLRIRDNGKGIPVNAETQGNGLLNMSRRAVEMRAELNITSANGEGTEIELMLANIK
jgi:two-component sensor histidine kinase